MDNGTRSVVSSGQGEHQMIIIRLEKAMHDTIIRDLQNHYLFGTAERLIASSKDAAEDGPEVEILRQKASNPCKLGS
jgi:hypothetical protein